MFKRLGIFVAFFSVTFGAYAATSGTDFQIAAQLLNAARSGNIQMVERLVNSGADANYTDSTGLSIVCTAIMNNDLKAAQILQIYGADASNCNNQIKRYKDKLPKENSGGLFSGLSNAQNVTLAAGGAALVIGGVYLLGDGLFGTSDSGSSPGTADDRPSTGGNTGGETNTGTVGATIAYGPAQWNFVTSKPVTNAVFDLTGAMNIYSTGSNQTDWNMMRNNTLAQNYLTLNGGYASFARGYFGQVIPRTTSNNPSGQSTGPDAWTTPIPVALITANGVNKAGTAAEHPCLSGSGTGCPTVLPPPRYKNDGTNGAEIAANISDYDYSGAGTVFNTNATSADSLLAKIIIGGTAVGDTRGVADYIGFMPNGQLLLYRTGGGMKYKTNMGAVVYPSAGFITIAGADYSVASILDENGYYNAAGKKYAINNGNLWEMESQAYRNFEAMNDAISKSVVVANASVPNNMKDSATAGMGTIVSSSTKSQTYLNLVDYYYYNDTDAATPDLLNMFSGGSNSPIIVFGSGEYKYGLGAGASTTTLEATFENAAPVISSALNHHFMTAVAVQLAGGTGGIASAASSPTFSSTKKYALSSYQQADGDIYSSRACGVAGQGYNTVDPWCFSAAGVTSEQAVSTLSGVAGTLKGAFNYMTTEQIFTLMALTSDGKYYSVSDLKNMYQLPADWNLPGMTDTEWKAAFAKSFGYGMVNLERATRPTEKLYFYSNSSTKTGYWSATPSANRAATVFLPSFVLGGRSATISTPMFDFVESEDGTESMPRVFDSEFAFGNQTYGLDLDDLMGEISDDNNIENEKMTLNLSRDGSTVKNVGINVGNFTAEYRNRIGNNTFTSDNPIMGLAGNMVTTGMNFGDFSFRAFSGNMTDESLLENDPVTSGTTTPLNLGSVYGFDSVMNFGNLSIGAGFMNESDTVLGSYSDGLFDLGGGKTVYGDIGLKFGPFVAKYTMAKTDTVPGFGFVNDVTTLYSDAYSVQANFGKWTFNLSRPLAVTKGSLEYVQTDFSVDESANGYNLTTNPYLTTINMAPENRETRLAVLYQPEISDTLKMAFGVVGRINPNNTSGHEEILLLKMRHIW